MRPLTCLVAVALCSQMMEGADSSAPSIATISLSSTKPALQGNFGPPEHVRQQPTFEVWDYNAGSADENDLGFAWSFYFDEPSGRLTAVTRNFEKAMPVDDLFSADAYKVATSPDPSPLRVLYRRIDSERLLIAVGVSHPSDLCSQVILIRRSALQFFYPWLSVQLAAK